MNRVISISLNGNAYHLEESGYEALRAYLAEARRVLADNIDLEEIMADLEQAIADKCHRFLNAGKDVVLTPEIEQIIQEMGPVDPNPGDYSGTGASAESPDGSGSEAASADGRKLYRLKDDRMLAGVCAGLAAYFGLDPTLMRFLFVIVLFSSGGLAIILYLVLMVVMPEATTPAQHAAAHGQPFNARGVIGQTKARFREFTDSNSSTRKAREGFRQQTARHGIPENLVKLLAFIALAVAALIGLSILFNLLHWILGISLFPGPPLHGIEELVFLALLILVVWALCSGNGSVMGGLVRILIILFLLWLAYHTIPVVGTFFREVFQFFEHVF